MKVLWHTNLPLPVISKHLHWEESVYGGWMTGLFESISQTNTIEIVLCFPSSSRSLRHGKIGSLTYYALPKSKHLKPLYQRIVEVEKPDLIHLFGTELPHVVPLIQAYGKPDRTVIQLQGIVTKIGELYTYGLPKHIINRYTFRDLIRHRNIKDQQHVFQNRGVNERQAIQASNHVIGRTAFDRSFAFETNPNSTYYHVNEILRHEFYGHKWSIEHIERHSMFISQAHYPIKGLHLIIPALASLCSIVSETKIYISGRRPFDDRSLMLRMKTDSYGKYIRSLLKKHHLENHVEFLGELTADAMVERYLRTHVFLSPSIIENESNALSEALLLGVPSVSSFVGGIQSRVEHQTDGLVYTLGDHEAMIRHIRSIFDNDSFANHLSVHAIEKAKRLFDSKTNRDALLNVYQHNVLKTS